MKKNKTGFEKYIPDAILSLEKIITGLNEKNKIPQLLNLVKSIL
jgi:hypothetical protein